MSMFYQQVEVTLEFTAPILGTVVEDSAIWEQWIRPKQSPLYRKGKLNPEEIGGEAYAEAVDQYLEKTADEEVMVTTLEKAEKDAQDEDAPKKTPVTSFFQDEHGPMLLNYQVLGHLKELGNLGKEAVGVKNLRNKISQYVYVSPRKIYFDQPITGNLTRPLRAETMQGPRVALASSDVVREGTHIHFTLKILRNPPLKGHKTPEVTADVLETLMGEMGEIRGVGQWRSSGQFGMYTIQQWDVTDLP